MNGVPACPAISRRIAAPGVLEIRLERPAKRNALRKIDKRAVAELIEQAAHEEGIRVVVLTGGDSPSFCAGTDIAEMSGLTVSGGLAMFAAEARLYDAVLAGPLPVVAAVRGAAFGAGCVLACCCDVTVASPSAVFAMPEVRNGVPAPLQAALIPRITGLGVARSMLYRLRRLDAAAALAAGIVDEIVAEDELHAAALAAAAELSALPAQTIALQKRIVGSWIRAPFDAAVESSAYVAASAFAGPIPQEAIDAFLRSRHERAAGRGREGGDDGDRA